MSRHQLVGIRHVNVATDVRALRKLLCKEKIACIKINKRFSLVQLKSDANIFVDSQSHSYNHAMTGLFHFSQSFIIDVF